MKNLLKVFSLSVLLTSTVGLNAQCHKGNDCCHNDKNVCPQSVSIYNFTANELETNKLVHLSDYKGKVLVIVNTASKCGLTPQYEGLEKLYKKYRNDGLEIIGFPCNQFKGQEPGDAKEIKEHCLLHYGVTFPMMSKIDVNGENTTPLYRYLKSQIDNGNKNGDIQWNFTKFVIDRKGNVVKRFEPREKPETMTSTIERLLSQK